MDTVNKEEKILHYRDLGSPKPPRRKVGREAQLSPLRPRQASHRRAMRIGRGEGSGKGKTCGRGQKGQKSRAGYSRKAGFEGGQLPLYRRLPKRGFHNPFSISYQIVNLEDIERCGLKENVAPKELALQGLIKSAKKRVKILGMGKIESVLHLTADAFSQTARAKIEAAGGSCLLRHSSQDNKRAGNTAEGNTAAGNTVAGNTAAGSAVEGNAAEGNTVEGNAVEGGATKGSAVGDGAATDSKKAVEKGD